MVRTNLTGGFLMAREAYTQAMSKTGGAIVTATTSQASASQVLRVIPGWVSVLPAIAAITIALTLRNVIR